MRSSNISFQPDADTLDQSQLTSFISHFASSAGTRFEDYWQFEAFAAEHYRLFWREFFEWSRARYDGNLDPVCVGERCESAVFFPEVALNYAEVLLGGDDADDWPALTAWQGDGCNLRLSRSELRARVEALAGALIDFGIVAGDKVVAIAHNNAQVAVAALATAAIGATFSSCSPDMGAFSILSRVEALEPVVLFANVQSGRRDADTALSARVEEVATGLTSLSLIIALDDGEIATSVPVLRLSEIIVATTGGHRPWVRRPFNHPLYVMFTSGTTGAPKCVVHGAGGTLLEHLKEHKLHCDLRRGDKLFFHTSCAWMMWNWQLSALASGAEIVLYDGPIESPQTLWRIVDEADVTLFGTNPAYLHTCIAADYSPAQDFAFKKLRGILSTGSVLGSDCYDWVGAHVKSLPLQSISGGTDIIGCFMLGNPNLPVMRGELQCRSIALDVRSSMQGVHCAGSVGDLICANPFPSRPLGFHSDPDGRHFHNAYFSQNPAVWAHGDLIEFTPSGGARLHGRSDSVLKIDGNRVGPADIYRILDTIHEVVAAAAVEQENKGTSTRARLVLLVILRSGLSLNARLEATIRSKLRRLGTASFVPAKIVQVDALPTTHNGKCSEMAVREAVNGRAPPNMDALRNPNCLATIGQLFAS